MRWYSRKKPFMPVVSEEVHAQALYMNYLVDAEKHALTLRQAWDDIPVDPIDEFLAAGSRFQSAYDAWVRESLRYKQRCFERGWTP